MNSARLQPVLPAISGAAIRFLPDCLTDKINPLAGILTLKFQNAVYSEHPPQYIPSNNKCMDAFSHIKSVIAIILGLSIAKLLQGAVKFIQHPGRTRPYWVHLLWALYIFILLVHFWWWEYGLRALSQWLFQEYLFIIIFITLYFVLCAL